LLLQLGKSTNQQNEAMVGMLCNNGAIKFERLRLTVTKYTQLDTKMHPNQLLHRQLHTVSTISGTCLLVSYVYFRKFY